MDIEYEFDDFDLNDDFDKRRRRRREAVTLAGPQGKKVSKDEKGQQQVARAFDSLRTRIGRPVFLYY
jgi:hypothetical protein